MFFQSAAQVGRLCGRPDPPEHRQLPLPEGQKDLFDLSVDPRRGEIGPHDAVAEGKGDAADKADRIRLVPVIDLRKAGELRPRAEEVGFDGADHPALG